MLGLNNKKPRWINQISLKKKEWSGSGSGSAGNFIQVMRKSNVFFYFVSVYVLEEWLI